MAKSIKKNFLYNLLLNVSKVIFPLITAPYVARVLEPDGVGLYNFSIMYVSYFALFPLLGVPTYGVREIAKIREEKDKKEKFVSEIISIQILLTVIVTGIFLATLFLIPQLYNNFLIFLIAGISLYTCPFIIDWYYKGMEEFKFITQRSLLIKVISIIALFLFVKEKGDLVYYVLIYSVANITNEIWNFAVLMRSGIRPRFTFNGLLKHIKPLLILFMSSIAISIYTTLDTLMLGFISDYNEVGYYNNATHVTRSLLMAITSLAIVAMPRISYLIKQGQTTDIDDLIGKSVSIVAFLAIPLSFALFLVSPTFVPLFFGEQYQGTIVPMQVLGLLMIAIGFNNLTGTQILLSFGYDKQFLISVVTGTLSNIVFNLFLIPSFGAIGASISSVFAEFMVLFVSLYYISKVINIKMNKWLDIIKTFVSLIGIYFGYLLSISIASDWMFIASFTILGSLFYIMIQSLLRNSSITYAINIIKNRKSKNDSSL